ncbi:unnamed protein product, partial [Heterotrigona itama]
LYVLFVAIVVAAADEDANDCANENKISKNCEQNEDCLRVIGSNEAQHIPYLQDCHKFYKCAEGKACLMCCPKMNSTGSERLVFNPELQVCDWPQNVKNPKGKCDDVNPTEPPTTSTEPSTTSTEPSTTSTEPSTTSTKPTASPTKPTASPTKPTASPTKPSPTPTESPKSECQSGGSTSIKHENDCTMYYKCKNGTREGPFRCGNGLVFNPIISNCDIPKNYPSCRPRNPEYFDN